METPIEREREGERKREKEISPVQIRLYAVISPPPLPELDFFPLPPFHRTARPPQVKLKNVPHIYMNFYISQRSASPLPADRFAVIFSPFSANSPALRVKPSRDTCRVIFATHSMYPMRSRILEVGATLVCRVAYLWRCALLAMSATRMHDRFYGHRSCARRKASGHLLPYGQVENRRDELGKSRTSIRLFMRLSSMW